MVKQDSFFFSICKRISKILLKRGVKRQYGEVEGLKMLVDEHFTTLIDGGDYEPQVTAVVKKVIKQNDIVVDIGANIGYYTLLFSKLVGKEGMVFAFEPAFRNYSLLKKNVELNSLKNVKIEKKAISNVNGKTKLHQSIWEGKKYLGNYWLGQPLDKEGEEIEMINLDTYFQNFTKKINFIKIDIEGSELPIFRNVSDEIFQKVDSWLIEYHSQTKEGQIDLDSIFREHGYFTKWLDPQEKIPHIFATKIKHEI